MKNRKNILKENRDLTRRLAEAEEVLSAIKSGAVDALVTDDNKVFTLKGSDYIYRVLVENMNEGAATLAFDGTLMYCNNFLAKMLGTSIEKIIGCSIFDFVGPDEIPKLKSILRQSENQTSRTIFQFKKKNKTYITVVVSCSSLKLKDAGICMIITDLTQQKKAEFELARQREELLHVTKLGKLAEFVSSLAHEISQPLTAILSYSQAAERILAGREPKLREILQYIIDDAQRAAEVIRRLRSLLKKSTPEIKPLDINALVNDIVVLTTTDATVRGISIKLDLEGGLPLVTGDQIQIQQVLLNLISNSFDAIESSSKGAREISICTSRKDADMIMVAVKDSGCGIPAQNMSKLFTNFFTSKPDGLGMGLSISRSIIESHGGQMYVRNNPNRRGATFSFTLPVDKKGS